MLEEAESQTMTVDDLRNIISQYIEEARGHQAEESGQHILQNK